MTARSKAGPIAALGSAIAIGTVAGGTACGRCTEFDLCTSPARFSYTVQMLDRGAGNPVAGVRVRFVRTSGVALAGGDTVDAVSGSDGFAVLRTTATAVGAATGDFVVTPPAPNVPYAVRAQEVQLVSGRGDGGLLGRWVVAPYIDFVGELGNYQTRVLLQGARVTFLRRSGLPVTKDSITDVTDASGRFFLRASLAPGAGAGELVGDLIVESATLPRTVRFTNVALPTAYLDRYPLLGRRFDVAPLLATSSARSPAAPVARGDGY